ncbi:MAG TPA: Gfo/Idh/MocA family oxidoreductase [Pyrinomonadaceae bacterium]|nr:Gfo/Idh/MocA family oxidoreductase [Pyrinomonadaceae bacterium]
MTRRVRWGVLGAAKIAVEKVIPAMQRGEWAEVVGLASRDSGRARRAADALGVPKAYGSYEELLADPEIEAVYNPLPNHLHVPWTIRAAEAGKHVLCEKPVSLDAGEARALLGARDRAGVKIQEAFMVRTHPQWLGALEVVRSGRIGELRAASCAFSFFNRDPSNIRNRREMGGGALMDIGCYPVNISRFVFGAEPRRVFGHVERDPEWGVDRLTSAVLEFGAGRATFTCSTQLAPYQRVQLFGTRGRVEVERPFNAPNDRPTRVLVADDSDRPEGVEALEFPACDQYTIQGDLFSRAVREGVEQPLPLEDAVRNMAVIDAVFRSAESGGWEVPEAGV